MERYLRGQASAAGGDKEQALRRMAGIGLDGYSIFFLRYRGDRPPPKDEALQGPAATQLPLIVEREPAGSFTLVGPYKVDEYSIEEFLLHLRALRRRPLAAEELAKEFGPAGGVAHEMVNALYTRLEECLTAPGSPFPRVQTLYEEWKRIFGIVYGQEPVKGRAAPGGGGDRPPGSPALGDYGRGAGGDTAGPGGGAELGRSWSW